MASLALGAAGAFVGSFFGPLGASIGWAVGSAIGSALSPQKVQGPRLSDLKLQTSSYGRMIPIAYGTIRVAGNVIWQTDLHEHATTSGGKGGPEVTTYSYTASFAVALCAGPIVAVTRVWADGRLVYDITPGAPVNSFPFTLYLGSETQTADPTMQSFLGAANVPGYRGTAYAVFNELALGDFGNRLPQLTFEVMTVGNTDAQLHFTLQNTAEPVTWDYNGSAGTVGRPAIIAYPQRSTGTIKVLNTDISHGGTGQEYAADLSYIGTLSAADIYPSKPTGAGLTGYYPVGVYNLDGNLIPIWVNPSFTIGSSTTAAALAGISLTYDSGTGLVTAGAELAAAAGIPSGRYIGGATLSADGTQLFIFTAPSTVVPGGNVIDRWDKIVNGVVVATGTCSPGKNINSLGFGNSTWYGYTCSSFENNGLYCWAFLANAEVQIYKIDSSANFALNAVNGTLPFIPNFNYGSIYAFADGYACVVARNGLAVVNRYPVGDVAAPTLAAVVSDLSTKAGLSAGQIDVTALANDYVTGYVIAQQGTVRSAIEPLQIAYAFDAVESDTKVKFVKRGAVAAATIAADDLAAVAGTSGAPAVLSTQRLQEAELPAVLSVSYLNLGADYQEGVQTAQRLVTASKLVTSVQLPLVFSDSTAKQIADRLMHSAWVEREAFKWTTGRKFAQYEPTDVLTVNGRTLRVTSKAESHDGVIAWEGVATVPTTLLQGGVAVPGSGFPPQVPPVSQATQLVLLDLPLIRDTDAPLGFYAAMCGTQSASWRGAALFKSGDGGVTFAPVLSNLTPDVMGTTTTVLGNFTGGNIFDETNTVTVSLSAGAPASSALSSTTELNVLNGANVAVIGSEVLQFKNATLVSAGVYALSGLLRGRQGTEWAMGTHAVGETFVLLPTSSNPPGPSYELNLPRIYRAVTNGKSLASALNVPFTNTGIAARPYAPVLLGGGRNAAGDITLTWTRRTRVGGSWLPYTDVPLSEAVEIYRVRVYASNAYATVKHEFVCNAPTQDYSASQQTTDFGSTQSTIYWDVCQTGTYGDGVYKRGST